MDELTASVYAPRPDSRPWTLEGLLGRPVRYYSLGRHALVAALRLARVGFGDGVLLPSFICRDLLASVHAVGAKVLFYDVDEKLALKNDPDSLPLARAIVAVDYFGFPQDLAPFKAYARRAEAAVIEDNAHGLFSRDETGAWLGTRADLGIFSPRKTLPLPGGGALSVRAGSYAPPLQLPGESGLPAAWLLKSAVRAACAHAGPAPARALLAAKRGLSRLLGRGEFAPSGPGAERDLPGKANPPAALLESRPRPGPDGETARRRALYTLCQGLAVERGARPLFARLPPGTVPYVYPFYAEGERLAAVRAALSDRGLDAFPWPELPWEVLPKAPAHYRNLWCARFLW